jgi:hypothetical protein
MYRVVTEVFAAVLLPISFSASLTLTIYIWFIVNSYRKDGTPFYCLLCIIPFRDVTGALICEWLIGSHT